MPAASPANATSGHAIDGGTYVLVAIHDHTYGHWGLWYCLWPWRWFGSQPSLSDLAYAALVLRDWAYVQYAYFSRWAREPCDQFCACGHDQEPP